jgi:hypothetical protein
MPEITLAEICLIDQHALNTCTNIFELPAVCVVNASARSQKKAMEKIAKDKFKRWEWRCNAKHLYPMYIADLDTGACLILR